MQRLLYPKVLLFGKFVVVSWFVAFIKILCLLFYYSADLIAGVCGHFLDIAGGWSLSSFFSSLGSNFVYYCDRGNYTSDFRFLFQVNDSLLSFESTSTLILIGSNLRLEAPLINIRFRKNFLNNADFSAYSFGLALNFLTFPIINVSNHIKGLLLFLQGKINLFCFLKDFFNLNYMFVIWIELLY